jgi:hypothetical protein
MAATFTPRAASKARSLLAILLIASGCIGATSFVAVRWAERNVLDTNGWTALVAQVPRDQEVATALSTNIVEQLFEQYDVQTTVAQALPDKAQFLAGPLTDQIKQKSRDVGSQFIASDQFQGIWVTANRVAQTRLIESARETGAVSNQLNSSELVLNLQGARQQITDRLGSTGTAVYSGTPVTERPIVVNVKSILGSVKNAVKTVDLASALLPPTVLALFLWAIAIAPRRRTMVLVAGWGIIFTAALQLILIKILRPEIVGLVQQAQYRGAVGNVWDILTHPYQLIAWRLFFCGFAVIVLAVLCGPSAPAIWVRKTLRVPAISASMVGEGWQNLVKRVQARRWYARLAIAVCIFSYLLLEPSLTWAVAVQALLWGCVAAAVLQLALRNSALENPLPAKG